MDREPDPINESQKVTPTGTDILKMSDQQTRVFRNEKLWRHMSPDQVVKLFSTRKGLVSKEGYEEVKGKAELIAIDALKEDIPLPTFEQLQEKAKASERHVHWSEPLVTEEASVQVDPVSEEPKGGNQDVQAVIKGDQTSTLPPGFEGLHQWADDQEKK